MIIKKCLIIITFIKRVSGYLDGLGEVTERQVERVDFVISWLVIEHNIKLLIASLVSPFLFKVLASERALIPMERIFVDLVFNELFFFLLV